GRDGDMLGNGFANHRSGDESCRRVWLVALGAGVPRGAGTERPIKTTDVAPTVARILGVKMPECEGQPLAELAICGPIDEVRGQAHRRSSGAGAAARRHPRAPAGDLPRVDPDRAREV